MYESDLGINEGAHNPELTPLERDCLSVLEERGKGAKAAISARAFAAALAIERTTTEKYHDDDGTEQTQRVEWGTRDLRKLINHLIMTHGIPIVCKAGTGGGYFLPGSEGEINEFYQTFHRRAMTGLVKASRGKRSAFVEIVTQLSLGFDEPGNRETIEKLRLSPDEDPIPAWVQVVTKFLDRIAEDPRKYAAEIRRIQTTYGDIFVPREKVRLLKEKTAEFQRLLKEIA